MDNIIRSMEIFVQVAQLGSFTKAAVALNIPKAGISMGISKLESHLGTRLLQRTTRSVSLTPDGVVYLEKCEALLADLEETEQLFRKDKNEIKGRIRVDVPSRIARLILIPQLPDFFKKYPHLNIEIGSTDRLIDLVQEGHDCVIRVGVLKDSSLIAKHIGKLNISNYASPEYLKIYGCPKSLDDLSNHYLIGYQSSVFEVQARFEYESAGETHSIPMRTMLQVNNAESYIAGALAGLGLIQVPKYDVTDHVNEGRLVEILSEYSVPSMPISFVYSHRKHRSNRLNVFIDWATQLIQEKIEI